MPNLIIPPRDLPDATEVFATDSLVVDNGATVSKATPVQIVDAGRAWATIQEAQAGTVADKSMSPLTTAAAISSQVLEQFGSEYMFADYAAALAGAGDLDPSVLVISADVGGTETRWIRDDAGTALGGGWAPAGIATPQHYGAADAAGLAAAVTDNVGRGVVLNYDAQILPADYSRVMLEYTEQATARNIQLTAPGAGYASRTFRTQFPEDHTGFQFHAVNIEAQSLGSGVNGPTTVENGLAITVAKKGFAQGTALGGGINCMYLYGRQDGPKGLPAGDIGSSDIGAIIANLSIVEDAGFLCISEATSTQIQGNTPFSPLLQIQTQHGVINGNSAGGSKSYGWLAISKVGVNTAAYYAASEGSSSWASLFLSPNKVDIDANGDYRSTQAAWPAGALNLERDKTSTNGNSTIRHRGTGSMRILAQENANISFGTNNTIHVRLGGDGNFVPNTAGGSNIGQPASRFGGVYSNVLDAAGAVTLANLPVYADNAAATAGGLAVGRVYRTAAGDLKVRF